MGPGAALLRRGFSLPGSSTLLSQIRNRIRGKNALKINMLSMSFIAKPHTLLWDMLY